MIEFEANGRKYYATFIRQRERLGPKAPQQQVTVCVLRTCDPLITVFGGTVKHPHDDFSGNLDGDKIAFSRATVNMFAALHSCGIDTGYWQPFRDGLRKALWVARNSAFAAKVEADREAAEMKRSEREERRRINRKKDEIPF